MQTITIMKNNILISGILAALLGFCACNNVNDSTTEANKKIITAYYNRVWNKGELAVLDTLLSPDYINHTPSTPNPPKRGRGLKAYCSGHSQGISRSAL
jgi:hypothetical protein